MVYARYLVNKIGVAIYAIVFIGSTRTQYHCQRNKKIHADGMQRLMHL